MKTSLAALFLAVAAPALAQPVETQAGSLRDSALHDDYAWDIVEGLTTEVGPRLAGTEARQNVAAWTAMLAVLSGGTDPHPKRRPRR